MIIDQTSVSQFLREFKELLGTSRNFYFVERLENNSFAIKLGLNINNIKTELLELSVADYCSGPKPDRDKPGDVWMFGKEISGCEAYIKLKIVDWGPERIAICISFHEAHCPLSYPLRK